MSTYDASAAAKSRNRAKGRFAEEPRSESTTSLSAAGSVVGEPDPYGGERVSGTAEVGEVVHYYDIANQHRNLQRVVALSTKHPKYGWDSGYTLEDTVTGERTTSDLRQHGWTRVDGTDA